MTPHLLSLRDLKYMDLLNQDYNRYNIFCEEITINK